MIVINTNVRVDKTQILNYTVGESMQLRYILM